MKDANIGQAELTKCTAEDAASCRTYQQNPRYRGFKNPMLNRLEMIIIGAAWGGLWGASADIAFHMSETFLIAGMAAGALAMAWILNRFYKHSEDGSNAGRDA